jgi:uncharacterized membrane protein
MFGVFALCARLILNDSKETKWKDRTTLATAVCACVLLVGIVFAVFLP